MRLRDVKEERRRGRARFGRDIVVENVKVVEFDFVERIGGGVFTVEVAERVVT